MHKRTMLRTWKYHYFPLSYLVPGGVSLKHQISIQTQLENMNWLCSGCICANRSTFERSSTATFLNWHRCCYCLETAACVVVECASLYKCSTWWRPSHTAALILRLTCSTVIESITHWRSFRNKCCIELVLEFLTSKFSWCLGCITEVLILKFARLQVPSDDLLFQANTRCHYLCVDGEKLASVRWQICAPIFRYSSSFLWLYGRGRACCIAYLICCS